MELPRHSTDQFPQADSLARVFDTVRAVASGATSDEEIAEAVGFVDRQGRYYRLAAESMGLLQNENNHASLTADGLELAMSSSFAERRELLARAVMSNPVLRAVVDSLPASGASRSELRRIYRDLYPGSATTADRRLSTAVNYLRESGVVDVDANDRVRRADGGAAIGPTSALGGITHPEVKTGPLSDESARQFAQYSVNLAALERASVVHQRLVRDMAASYGVRGIDSIEHPQIDLIAFKGTERVICEMKSTSEGGENYLSQVRKAVAQLLEYRYLFDVDAALCLVTDAPLPSQLSWLGGYLQDSLGIRHVWIDERGRVQGSEERPADFPDWA